MPTISVRPARLLVSSAADWHRRHSRTTATPQARPSPIRCDTNTRTAPPGHCGHSKGRSLAASQRQAGPIFTPSGGRRARDTPSRGAAAARAFAELLRAAHAPADNAEPARPRPLGARPRADVVGVAGGRAGAPAIIERMNELINGVREQLFALIYDH